MANQIKISYDVDADLLEISLGTSRPAVSQEIIPDLFVRYDLNTFEAKKQGNEIVGFTVSNVSLWNAGDFLRLADAFPNGTPKHLIQWIQEDLAGKPMNRGISESSVDIYTPHEHQ